MFKRCADMMVFTWLAAVVLGLVLGVVGPRLIQQLHRPPTTEGRR